jgi:hypothetical protein
MSVVPPADLNEIFHGFPQSLQANSAIVHRLGHYYVHFVYNTSIIGRNMLPILKWRR